MADLTERGGRPVAKPEEGVILRACGIVVRHLYTGFSGVGEVPIVPPAAAVARSANVTRIGAEGVVAEKWTQWICITLGFTPANRRSTQC